MNVLYIIPWFYPAHGYGGPVQAVFHLSTPLAQSGCQVKVLTTNANGADATLDVDTCEEVEVAQNLWVRYCRRIGREAVSPEFLRCLPHYLRWADVVHINGVYNFPTIPALFLCKLMQKPVIWSPHGALHRWEHSRRPLLKAVWDRACKLAAPSKTVFHVTSETEKLDSLKRYPKLEAVVIPNGVEVPETIERAAGNGTLRLLYLGRLDPIKGVERLLAACKLLREQDSLKWLLTIAGDGEKNYVAALQSQIADADLSENVRLVGEVAGTAKRRVFENADVLVAPSFSENFGMVIAESLAYGVPVIASRRSPWEKLEEVGCGFWVENQPETIAEAIRRISQLRLAEMGRRGRDWARREFDCRDVARRMKTVYEELLRVNA